MSSTRIARLLTDVLDPKNVITALCLLVGAHYGWHGVGWGVLAIVFCAAIPIAFIVLTGKEKTFADRHVPERARRMIVIPAIVASVLTCLTLMVVGGAPAPLLSMVGAMLATITAIWPVTKFTKISVHTAVLAGALAMLGLLYGPWWIPAAALIPLVAWSRAQLKDHTPAQTVAGAFLGALVAAPVFALGL
jgi:membrane-associated phospholipid phosphatase